MNIVLIGMRGSGKTTVGKILAHKLGRELIEMDELITRKTGLTIPEMVEKYGWAKFRDIEEEITDEVAKRDNIINASGGGVVTREKNIQRLKKTGVLVWLQADVDTLVSRIGEDKGRPPLVEGRTGREAMEITSKDRKRLYQQAADLTINTENKTPEEVAKAIINLIAIHAEAIINLLAIRGEFAND
jgi:shikimate kinase